MFIDFLFYCTKTDPTADSDVTRSNTTMTWITHTSPPQYMPQDMTHGRWEVQAVQHRKRGVGVVVLIPRKGSFFHFHYIFITLVTLLQNPIACRCNTDSHQNTMTTHTITTAGLCWGAHGNPKCDSEATSIGPQYQAGNGRDGVYSRKGTSYFYYIAFAKDHPISTIVWQESGSHWN